MGSLALSETTARSTIDLAERNGLRLSAGWGHRFLGDVLYELDDLEGAIAHYSAAALDHEFFHLKGLREALFGLAMAYQAVGRAEEAWRALRRSREIAVAAGVVHHLPVIEAQEAYLALQSGNRARAAVWAETHDPALGSEPFHVLVHPAVIYAAVLCTSDDPREIAKGIDRLRVVREQMIYWGFPGPLVRVDALLAVALLRRGEQDAALASMQTSLMMGPPHGHVRSYLDLLPAFSRELLALAPLVDFPLAVQQTLPVSTRSDSGQSRGTLALGPLDALTEREQDVLAFLFQRLSYREIGDQLFISPHTVKRHVTSIYSKLDVSGRTEAINVARERGWRA